MISVFLCLSLGLLPSAPVTSEIIWYTGPMPLTRDTIDKRGGQKVVRLIIEGVCEQNKHIVRAITDIRSGEHLASVNPELIKKNLAETGLFSQAEIFYRPTMHGIILTLSLKEKKQALGLPSFRLSESDVYSGGAFFREDPIAISAEGFNSEVWQAGGLNGFIKYKNPELKGRNQKMEILFRGKFETRTQTLADGSPIRRFKGYSGHLEMQWGFQTDARFRPTFLLFYDMFDVDTTWKENLEPP